MAMFRKAASAAYRKRPTPRIAGQTNVNVSQDAATRTIGGRPAVPSMLRKARKKAALSMMRGI